MSMGHPDRAIIAVLVKRLGGKVSIGISELWHAGGGDQLVHTLTEAPRGIQITLVPEAIDGQVIEAEASDRERRSPPETPA